MQRRLRKPDPGIEYTFVFQNGVINSFVLLQELYDGKLLMKNLTKGNNTTFDPKRMHYLLGNAVIERKQYYPPKAKEPQQIIVEDEPILQDYEIDQFLTERINILRNLSHQQRFYIEKSIGRSTRDLIRELELENQKSKDEECCGKSFLDMEKAISIINQQKQLKKPLYED